MLNPPFDEGSRFHTKLRELSYTVFYLLGRSYPTHHHFPYELVDLARGYSLSALFIFICNQDY